MRKLINRVSSEIYDFVHKGSIHGLKHFINPFKGAFFRLIHTLLFLFATLVSGFLVGDCVHEHLVVRPVVTNQRYEQMTLQKFPDVYLCPQNSNHDALVNKFFPPTLGTIYFYLSALSQHQMLSDLQTIVRSRNVSALLEKYPNSEQQYKKFYNSQLIDASVADFYSMRLLNFHQFSDHPSLTTLRNL